jgi:hypothetical protein
MLTICRADVNSSGVVDEMEYVHFYIAMQQAVQKCIGGTGDLPSCAIIEDARREFKRDCSLVGAHRSAHTGLVRRHFFAVFLELPKEIWITLECLDANSDATCELLDQVQHILQTVPPRDVLGVLVLQRAWRCSQARSEAKKRREERLDRKRRLRQKWQQQKTSMIAKQFMTNIVSCKQKSKP